MDFYLLHNQAGLGPTSPKDLCAALSVNYDKKIWKGILDLDSGSYHIQSVLIGVELGCLFTFCYFT